MNAFTSRDLDATDTLALALALALARLDDGAPPAEPARRQAAAGSITMRHTYSRERRNVMLESAAPDHGTISTLPPLSANGSARPPPAPLRQAATGEAVATASRTRTASIAPGHSLSAPSVVLAGPPSPRVSFDPALHRHGAVDGGWRPYSRNALAELPGLIAALDARPGVRVQRLSVHRDDWDEIPRRLAAEGGHVVRVDWFTTIPRHTVSVTTAGPGPIALLVVPPGTAEGTAQTAMNMAATGPGSVQAAGILTASEPGGGEPARPGRGDGLKDLAAEPAGAAGHNPGAPGGR